MGFPVDFFKFLSGWVVNNLQGVAVSTNSPSDQQELSYDASSATWKATPSANVGSCGRLTLTSGTPVLTANVTAAATLYYTPYLGNLLGLYNGTAWKLYQFNELSLAGSNFAAASTLHDIFIYDNSGTLTLEAVAWTSSGAGTSARATNVTLQNGIPCKTGTLTHRYLGTILTNSTGGQIDCVFSSTTQAPVLGIWNYNNRKGVTLSRLDPATAWTCTSTSWQQLDQLAANQCNVICGLAEDDFSANAQVHAYFSVTGTPCLGIGINSTTVLSGMSGASSFSGGVTFPASCGGSFPAAGFNYLAALQKVYTNSAIYYGNAVVGSGISINTTY